MSSSHRVSLFIEPPSHHFTRDRLFESNAVPFAGDQLMAPYAHLRDVLQARGVEVHTADMMPGVSGDRRIAYASIGNLTRYESLARRPDVTLSALFAMECPILAPALYRGLPKAQRFFRRIYSWSDSASLRRFTGMDLRLERFYWPQSFSDVHEALWARTGRKFLVIMHGNKIPALRWGSLHDARLRAVEYFSRTGEIDLYGREWDQAPARVGTNAPYTLRFLERRARAAWQRLRRDPLLEAARKVWKGPARSKSETLSGYTFAICFENMVLKGWITEKIFDCFFTGTIPLYLGAPDIEESVPPECFVDMRRFCDYAELHEFLRTMDEKDIARYREAARAYLQSRAFARFSKQAFAELFVTLVQCDGVEATKGKNRDARP